MCHERYEQLLEEARGGNEEEEKNFDNLPLTGIDTLAEHRPAKADPVDMEDHDREMIAEARVRFANVKGKKGTRKARIKVLEEARRLATI